MLVIWVTCARVFVHTCKRTHVHTHTKHAHTQRTHTHTQHTHTHTAHTHTHTHTRIATAVLVPDINENILYSAYPSETTDAFTIWIAWHRTKIWWQWYISVLQTGHSASCTHQWCYRLSGKRTDWSDFQDARGWCPFEELWKEVCQGWQSEMSGESSCCMWDCWLCGVNTLWPGPIVSQSHCVPILLCPDPIVFQSCCFPVPLCSNHAVFQSLCAPVPLCPNHVVSRSSCVPVPLCPNHAVSRSSCAPVPLCPNHAVSRSSCVPVPLCPNHAVFQSHCVPIMLCPNHAVLLYPCVPVPLCHNPIVSQSCCFPVPLCPSPIVSQYTFSTQCPGPQKTFSVLYHGPRVRIYDTHRDRLHMELGRT